MMALSHHPHERESYAVFDSARVMLDVRPGCGAFFKTTFLAARKWRAVAVSEEMTPSEASVLAAACKRVGYTRAVSIDVDHFTPGTSYDVPLNASGIGALEKMYFTPSYLLLEEHERFALVSDSDYYWAIAGDPAFLDQCFAAPVETIIEDFAAMTWQYRDDPSPARRFLAEILDKTKLAGAF